MDKLQSLLKGLEKEFQISTIPTKSDVESTVGTNIKELQEARAQVQSQLDEVFNRIVGYIKFSRASAESLIKLRNYIDAEIESLKATQSPNLKVG